MGKHLLLTYNNFMRGCKYVKEKNVGSDVDCCFDVIESFDLKTWFYWGGWC